MERQPTRSKRVVKERRFDKTQLRAAGHGRTVHRDYGAHVLRWNFVAEEIFRDRGLLQDPVTGLLTVNTGMLDAPAYLPPYLKDIFFRFGWVSKEVKQGMKILDVGCGQDQPLLYVVGARIQTVPELYVGVDLNRIMRKSNVRWAKIYDECQFTDSYLTICQTHGQFDLVTCFEVIEHMAPEDGAALLAAIRYCLKPGAKLLLSTPVFDGMAAANHVHEFRIPELQALIESNGFKVERRYGTFASKPDIRHAMKKAGREDHLKTYDELEPWFGGDVISTFMAPLYPDASRNNLWVLRKPS